MDASWSSSDFLTLVTVRSQSYIRPVCAGWMPAGPDGIRRRGPHLNNEHLRLQFPYQVILVSVLPVRHHL